MKRPALLATLAVASLIGAACGGDDDGSADTEAPPATEASVETDAPVETEVPVDTEAPPATEAPPVSEPEDVPAGPERVVSLSPTHTEMVFAIGAGDLLVAVDDFSNHPAEALELPNELSGFEPNVEAIAEYEPDLVLIGGDFTGLGPQLDELGIGWFDGPAAQTFDDTYAQIAELGDLLGFEEEADALVSSMQERIDAAVAGAPALDAPLSVYHEVDDTYYSADSTSFIGATYALMGLENIADQAEGENFGFPQLNPEAIIAANPDLIFLPCGTFCFTTADDVAARPGWDAIAAVQNGDIIDVDEDIASRWGPRIVEYVEAVGAAIDQAVS